MIVDLFKELVRYHIEHNLPNVVASNVCVQEGVENRVAGGQPVHGVLIAANGPTLEDKLKSHHVISKRPGDGQMYLVARRGSVIRNYLADHANDDGGYLWNGSASAITHVSRFNTSALSRLGHLLVALFPSLGPQAIDYERFVPHDFLSYDGSLPVYAHDECKLGTKTMAAIDLAHRYGVQTMVIKQSAYGPPLEKDGVVGIGLGKVCRFNRSGLAEEVYFVRSNDDGPFVDEEHKIVAIRRCYEKREGALVKVSEERIDPAKYFAEPIAAVPQPVRRPVIAYATP